jgi:hypothetical protein
MRVILGKGRINLRETTTRVVSQTARAKQHNESSYKSSKILTRSIQPLQDVLDLVKSLLRRGYFMVTIDLNQAFSITYR